MEDFQKSYIEKMGGRIEALQAACSGLDKDFFEAAASIRRMAHALRGSGATYGFPEISELAAAAEEAPDRELRHRVQHLIDHLRSLYSDHRPDREHILVVDDSEELRLMLRVILEAQGYSVTTAENGGEGQSRLKEKEFDLLILDLVLPDLDGRNFLIKLREDPATALLPVMVLSAKNSPQIKAECYALGADEYFEKPLDPALLTTRVAVSLQRSRHMERQTRRDLLTGLPNRAAFTEAFDQAHKAVELTFPSCVAMLDIDHFKRINDKFGHPLGDKVLIHTAQTLQKQLRTDDILARWGGEEFTVFLPATDLAEAKSLLKQLLENLVQRPFVSPSGQNIPISLSGGVVQAAADVHLADVLAQADLMLYRAKAAGRNCIMGPDDHQVTLAKKVLIAEDDDLTAEFILHRLKKDGFEIEHHMRGDLALAAARKKKFDLAIFDVKMPGMEGFELLQRTRADSLNQDTPVIMLTSMGSEQDISRGLAMGANDYVLKPFSPMELMARIRRLLK